MNATKTDNQPITDAEIEALGYQELMMAYLVRALTDEQKARVVAKLKTMQVAA